MPTFEFNDGTNFTFAEFEPDTNYLTNCTMPTASAKSNGYGGHAYIYQLKDDNALTKQGYSRGLTKEQQNQIRVGILRDATKHPYPKGLYIPYKITQWGAPQHCMDELQGDFIVHKPKEAAVAQ